MSRETSADVILAPLRILSYIIFLPFILVVLAGAIITGNADWLKERDE